MSRRMQGCYQGTTGCGGWPCVSLSPSDGVGSGSGPCCPESGCRWRMSCRKGRHTACAEKLAESFGCLPGCWRLGELTETLAAGAPEREARAQKVASPAPLLLHRPRLSCSCCQSCPRSRCPLQPRRKRRRRSRRAGAIREREREYIYIYIYIFFPCMYVYIYICIYIYTYIYIL